MRSPSRRSAVALALTVGASALTAVALTSAPAAAAPSAFDAQSTAGHAGHKVTHPTIGAAEHSRSGKKAGALVQGSGQLAYGGGVDGIGVTTGPPKVYLVFWGTQWGTAGTDGSGNTTLSGDTKGIAPVLQRMFKGLGTGGETWSGVMTQYCETTAGATSCPSASQHVGAPTGDALGGVWVDSSATPAQSTDHQLGAEALAAAAHFGNTSAAANRNAQYVVVSPTGTHPGGYNTTSANWCAWHDWNGDTTLVGGAVASTYGDIAFTNLPYIPDMGASCGANYVNLTTAGALDGVTIVEGHEYSETITDQNPAGGWTDRTGYENADKCSWVGVGGTGGAQNVTFGTGTFAMQGTYSNDSVNCRIAHPIVTNGTGTATTVTVAGIAAQTTPRGTTVVPVTAHATDSDATITTFTWSASGLPSGVSINSSTGVMSGKVGSRTRTTTVRVTARDSSGSTGSTTFTWRVQ